MYCLGNKSRESNLEVFSTGMTFVWILIFKDYVHVFAHINEDAHKGQRHWVFLQRG